MLTIPYHKNLKVKINGENTDTYQAFNTFLSITLSDGINNIEIIYKDYSL